MQLDILAPWLTIVFDPDGRERVLVSDGWHHIRLDVEQGRLTGAPAVQLRYDMHGLASAEARLLPLRRFLDLCRHRRFGRALYPHDPRIARWIHVLRVHDAMAAGASQREIAVALFGEDRVRSDWSGGSDSLRSRVRRLAREAAAMANGGYRTLLRRRG